MESVAVRTALLNDAQQVNSPTGDQEYPLSSLVIPYVSSTCTECGRAVVGATSVVEIIGSGSSTGSIPSVRDVSFQRARKHRSRSATAGPTTFTCWASFNNAVRTATDYIYIEDQYFLAFGSPPSCLAPTPGFARDTDPLWQLGQALLRGVSVVIVTSSSAEDPVHDGIKFQRGPGHPVTGCLGDDRRRGVRSGCGGRGGGSGWVRWSGAGCR